MNQIDFGNVFADIPARMHEEFHQTLLTHSNLRIERIVSSGQTSPDGFWYDQDENEWVVVLKGAARIRSEGEENPIALKPGDFLYIPAHKRHRVEWTAPNEETIWLAVYFG
jgi:cupin 2 domain-containing protein